MQDNGSEHDQAQVDDAAGREMPGAQPRSACDSALRAAREPWRPAQSAPERPAESAAAAAGAGTAGPGGHARAGWPWGSVRP